MIVLDTSAVVAVLTGEGEAVRFRDAILKAERCRMSAFNVFECRTVLGRRHGEAMIREFELFLATAAVAIDPFDADQAVLAYEGYERFGKGGGHPAQLNLGDCAAYALATSRGLPLLFKGSDFAMTDVKALP